MTKKILTLLVLFLATACSLPGGDDLNAPDETKKDSKNKEYLEKIHEAIKGEYPVALYQNGIEGSQCVIIDIDHKTEKRSENSTTQPVMTDVLFAKFTALDSFISNEYVEGRYNNQTGNIDFFLPPGDLSAKSGKILGISGTLINGQLNADLQLAGYPIGNIRGKLSSHSGCPTKSQLANKVKDIFSHTWIGTSEEIGELSPAMKSSQLKIDVDVVQNAGAMVYDITANFSQGNAVNTLAKMEIRLNEFPVVVNFSPYQGETPKFRGKMISDDTIEGYVTYPNMKLKIVFKRKK